LIKKIELKAGEVQSIQMTIFTCMAEVVSGAFGGKKDEKEKTFVPHSGAPIEDLTKLPPDAYLRRANQLLSGRF
jgi:hypothetical protein